ncbi:MAG: FAD-dependent oxidoreductase [Desulfobacterales bacterium]|nr:FAD-dependent oxidoreductase [Desulfobacterales bacterium]
MESRADVIVIGGGVIGLACAHYLRKKGLEIMVLERDEVGNGASHGNCGLLYFSDIYPLCQPGAVSQEILRTLQGCSPLYIKPTLNIKRLLWLLKFAANCTPEKTRSSAQSKHELLQYSLSLYGDILDLKGMDCDFADPGIFVVFKEKTNFDQYRDKADKLARTDLPYRQIFPGELSRLEPAISPDMAGAWFSPHDHLLRPDRLISCWKKHLREEGVAFVENCAVEDVQLSHGRISSLVTPQGEFSPDEIILATGAWSAPLAKQMKFKLPVEPGKGYSITMERPDLCPKYGCYFYEENVVATPWNSGFRLGGTMEFSGDNTRMNLKRLNKLAEAAGEYLSHSKWNMRTEEWTSLRPMTQDDMPIIGRAPGMENLTLATGHGMLGLTLATGTGKIVCDILTGEKAEVNIQPYSPMRFS